MYKGAHREDFDAVQDAVSDLWYIGVDRMVPEKTSAVVGAIKDDDYTSEYVIAFSLSHCDGFDYTGTSDELLDLANKCLNLAIVKHSPRTKTAFAIKSEPVGVPDISDNGWEYSVRLVWVGDTDERLSSKGSMRRKQESLKKESYPDFATKEDLIRAFTNMKEAWACIVGACHDFRFKDKYGVNDWFNEACWEYDNPNDDDGKKIGDHFVNCFSGSFDELEIDDFCNGMIAYLDTLQEVK